MKLLIENNDLGRKLGKVSEGEVNQIVAFQEIFTFVLFEILKISVLI